MARFDEVLSVLAFDEKLRDLPDTRQEARNQDWRRILYSGVIVNLYGGLEEFVDDLIERYASLCNTLFPIYEDLPSNLRKAHDAQARMLLTREGTGRLSRDDIDSMVRCLASCLDGGKTYSLSGTALSFHDRNLKWDVIAELFGRIDLTLRDGPIEKEVRFFADGDLVGIYASLDKLLVDLVDRRNEISHGGYSDLSSPEILSAVTEVLKWLARSLVNELRKQTFFALAPSASKLGSVRKYLPTIKAHTFVLEAEEVTIGDVIFGVERKTNLLRAARVVSLRDNDADVDCVIRDSMLDHEKMVGIKIEPEIQFAGPLYVLNLDVAQILYDEEYEILISRDVN
ncbi:MAE_28990/MAE_18760 family HEPN-like nuclease [Kitasatospora cineracea]|uniref:MAE_28990/MAE_18760 family HEPN-like nuclease n=1 Tax=Kitasatospora cineracea TaxID=88074 RepID=UPI000F513E6D|nr:MAE_28990/MAE_18760 family HEPN-like nuclease [Kitasatospora cineracea]